MKNCGVHSSARSAGDVHTNGFFFGGGADAPAGYVPPAA